MRLIGMNQSVKSMYKNQRAGNHDVSNVGFRYHMSNPHAAMGLAQMSKINFIASSRRASCELYSEILGGIDSVITPGTKFEEIVPFLYYIRVDKKVRDKLRNHLMDQGIDKQAFIGNQGITFHFFRSRSGDLSVTDKIALEIISLTSFWYGSSNDSFYLRENF